MDRLKEGGVAFALNGCVSIISCCLLLGCAGKSSMDYVRANEFSWEKEEISELLSQASIAIIKKNKTGNCTYLNVLDMEDEQEKEILSQQLKNVISVEAINFELRRELNTKGYRNLKEELSRLQGDPALVVTLDSGYALIVVLDNESCAAVIPDVSIPQDY